MTAMAIQHVPPNLQNRVSVRRGEAAELLGVSLKTIDRMVSRGTLESIRDAHTRLIAAGSVLALLTRNNNAGP